jgi:cytochrome b561
MLKNTRQGYGAIAIALHWLTALTVLALLPLGLWMVELDYYDTWYHKAPDVHKSTGVLLFLVVVLRLFWRSLNPHPVPLGSQLEKRVSKIAHRALYALLLLLMISGYLISTAEGDPIGVFNWFSIPATLHGLRGQADIAGEIHELLAFTLIGLVAVHAGAALKHHFIDRDRTLSRMLGTRKPGGSRTPHTQEETL